MTDNTTTPGSSDAGLSINATFKHDDVDYHIYGGTVSQVQAAIAALRGKTSVPKAEAPGKPSAAKPAPSPRTAEAAPSPSAPSAGAPAASTGGTPSDAAATSAGDKPVTYADLQKAVITLHKQDPKAAVPIAKSLGADTFKALPEDKWAEALRLVNEAIAERQVA